MNNSDIDNQRHIKSIDSWMDGDMLFLREQDKIQIRSISGRLSEDNPYVALCGPRVDLLNYYFEYLYAKLKESDRYQLEVFFSVTTDALLDFYNKRLKDISVNAAKSATDSELHRKILVISDCTGMAKNEWDLLARLLIDFPGANCGLLIICEEPFNQEVEAFFKLLGSRLTRCYCNFPDARELVSFLDASSLTPYHSHNKKKLAALGITGSDLEIDRTSGYSDEESIDVSAEVTGEKKFNKFLSFTFALILIVAFGVAYQLNDENAADFKVADRAIDNSSDDAALAQESEVEIIDDSLDNLSGSLIEKEVENDSLPSNENSMQVLESTGEEDFVEPIVEEISADNLPTETEFKEESVMIEEDIASSIIVDEVPLSDNTNEIEEPYKQILEEKVDEESKKDQLDNSIDPAAFYLQHAALSSQIAASTAATEIFADFSTTFSLPQFSQTKLWHVVFSGPYATRDDAMNVAKENEATADVVIVRGEYIVSRVPSEVEDDGR